MKHLLAKILVSVACAIIMLHAFVPHHHHDCDGEGGMVFETELDCHCNESCPHHHDEHHHSHHPFDVCLLQEMLSHLVLTTNDDQHIFYDFVKAADHLAIDFGMPNSLAVLPNPPFVSAIHHGPIRSVAITRVPMLGTQLLRAPPMHCAISA